VDQGYRSGSSLGSKLGYVAGCFFGLLVLGAGMFVLFLGDCPTGAACHQGEGRRLLILLIGAAFVATVVGLAVRQLVDRKRTG
jgi:uncharacterized membrane protein YhaH (DUF805 family)